MQSIDLGSGNIDFSVAPLDRVLRAPVGLVTTLLTRAISQGSITQIYRLARWILSKKNGTQIVESLTSLLMTSALESMQSRVTSAKKEVVCKLSVPGVVCCLLFSCLVMRTIKDEDTETKYMFAR